MQFPAGCGMVTLGEPLVGDKMPLCAAATTLSHLTARSDYCECRFDWVLWLAGTESFLCQ